MILKCYADTKHFLGRKASLTMLAGTTTAKVVQIGSSNSQSEWWNLQHGQKGGLWYSSPKCNCFSITDVVTMLRGKGTRGSRLQMGIFVHGATNYIENRRRKATFIFIRLLLFWPNCSCASYAGNFSVNIELAQKIRSSTQRKLDEGLE